MDSAFVVSLEARRILLALHLEIEMCQQLPHSFRISGSKTSTPTFVLPLLKFDCWSAVVVLFNVFCSAHRQRNHLLHLPQEKLLILLLSFAILPNQIDSLPSTSLPFSCWTWLLESFSKSSELPVRNIWYYRREPSLKMSWNVVDPMVRNLIAGGCEFSKSAEWKLRSRLAEDFFDFFSWLFCFVFDVCFGLCDICSRKYRPALSWPGCQSLIFGFMSSTQLDMSYIKHYS